MELFRSEEMQLMQVRRYDAPSILDAKSVSTYTVGD